MRATLIHGAGDVRGETVPDPKLIEPTDARCGSTGPASDRSALKVIVQP